MACRQEISETIREHFQFLRETFGVRRIALFGSVARGEAKEDSDVDLVVEFNRPVGVRLAALVEYLEGLLHRKVDILTMEGLRNIRVRRVAEEIARDLTYV
jgi:predicted nucleotidyltransferase